MRNDQQTFEAFAAAVRGLVPELLQLSIHDVSGQPLWMSADYLRPEDDALVSEVLQEFAVGNMDRDYVVRDDARILAPINLQARAGPHGIDGPSVGIALLELGSVPRDGWPMRRLAERLQVVLWCLGVQIAAEGPLPSFVPPAPDTAESPAGDPAMCAHIVAALKEERLELFLQPILPLRAGLDLLRFEVLVRLRTAAGVLLAPGAFLPVAQRQGLMPDIDRWVVRTLLAWLMNNRKRWFRVPCVFAVNVAGESLAAPGFLDFIDACLSRSGVPAQALCIEISVETALDHGAEVGAAARHLEGLGCAVAIDDFGSNDLAFSYLRGCPAQFLKIDRILVSSAHRDRVAGAVVSGIVRMAEVLGARTVAESIESPDELAAMRALGVDFAQGFLLGHPAALSGVDFVEAAHTAIVQAKVAQH